MNPISCSQQSTESLHLARIAQDPLSLPLVSAERVQGNGLNELGREQRVLLEASAAHLSINQGILRVFARRLV